MPKDKLQELCDLPLQKIPLEDHSDEVDVAIFNSIIREFASISAVDGIGAVVDHVIDYCRADMKRLGVGMKRVSNLCSECHTVFVFVPPNRSKHKVPVALASAEDLKCKICMLCNEWIHPTCYEIHVGKHVPNAICKGFRREAERLTAVQAHVDIFGKLDVPDLSPLDENFSMYFQKPKRRRNIDEISARSLQEANSLEEGAAPANFCSQCGSDSCVRKGFICRGQERFALTKHIYGAVPFVWGSKNILDSDTTVKIPKEKIFDLIADLASAMQRQQTLTIAWEVCTLRAKP